MASTIPIASPDEALKRLLPWLVGVAFFMQALDMTILNTAVPAIAHAMDVRPLSVKSVLASYMLSLAVFIPVSGWLADRFGTRRVFAGAIALFTLGSVLCGLSDSLDMLIAWRVLQGAGGAMMIPVGRLTLVRTYDKSDLVRVLSFVALPALVGPLIGPVLGGLIVSYLDWRYVFYVNVPVGLLGLAFVARRLPDYREASVPPLDAVGLVLFGGGVALLSYVLEIFGEHELSAVEILALFVVSLLLLALYGVRTTRVAHPILDLSLFRVRTFRAAVVGGFVARLGMGGAPFLFPLLYQIGFGLTPVQSGLLILPQAIASIGLKRFVPAILEWLGFRAVLVGNTVLLGLMMASFATVGVATPIWLIVLQALALGFFMSLQYSAMNSLVFADVATTRTSAASTIAAAGQQLSASFGVAVAALTAAFFVPPQLHSHPAAIVDGVHHGFLALAALTILSAATFMELRADDGQDVSRHPVDPHPVHEH
ncbi:DHA2 family efflux MFS transporter permease subunit [Reyranella sp.]|uniref:DHA2 family efflux MFS transporter permease subunit n=1 Tax=Reyranella sp. TaxID=1929291 RepID=UPI003BAA584C